jgi:hypothetical protein
MASPEQYFILNFNNNFNIVLIVVRFFLYFVFMAELITFMFRNGSSGDGNMELWNIILFSERMDLIELVDCTSNFPYPSTLFILFYWRQPGTVSDLGWAEFSVVFSPQPYCYELLIISNWIEHEY